MSFPTLRWVKTVLYDGTTPYIGFTYVDRMKGHCVKGEVIEGLSHDEIKKRLQAPFPSSTIASLPDDHPATVLTAEEIESYGLPAKPDWVSHFER